MKKSHTLPFLLSLLALPVLGQITIENWSLTEDSLSFEITGSDTASFSTLGMSNNTVLYVGVPDDGDWAHSQVNDSGITISGSADGQSIYSAGISNFSSDYITIGLLYPPDFTDGGAVSINFSTNAGSYSPENLTPEDLIITWGYKSSSPFPNPSTQIGSFGSLAAVPEPATFASLAGLFALGFATTRRRRARG